MIEHRETTQIDATPDQVWAVLTDASVAHRWMSAVDSSERDGPLEPGSTIRSKAGFLGLSFDVENEITEVDEPSRYTLEGDKPFPTRLKFELSESDAGTEVTVTTRVDPGKFFPVPGMVLKRQVKKQARTDGQALKDLVERG